MRIMTFDPGESTGWCVYDTHSKFIDGGTLIKQHTVVAEAIARYKPDVVVYESFKLYPGKAKSLSWNSFYPCEVIGVIKYICMENAIPMEEQAPSVKKYAGGFRERWVELQQRLKDDGWPVTEHVKDAYLHLEYYLRFKRKEIEERTPQLGCNR